jgi:hypothetical protein
MTSHPSHRPVSALRARMIEDMRVRAFTEKTRNDYVRNVRAFAAFIGRSPDTATAEDLRRFQLHQTQTGMQPPSINSAVAARTRASSAEQDQWRFRFARDSALEGPARARFHHRRRSEASAPGFSGELVELPAGPRAIIPGVFLASGGQKVSYT